MIWCVKCTESMALSPNGTTYIFSDRFFWILSNEFTIEGKTPKPIASVLPQFSGKLLHVFNYNTNAYMIVENWDQMNANIKKEVFIVKYNPIRIEKVTQKLKASKIPYIECFDIKTGNEMCFYIPELHSNSLWTTVTDECFGGKAFATIGFFSTRRSFASTREITFSFGGSYLPIRADAHLSDQNGVEIDLFLDRYDCFISQCSSSLCEWITYEIIFCRSPQIFNTVRTAIVVGFLNVIIIWIILCNDLFII